MIPSTWKSENLCYSLFTDKEVLDVKNIFDSNSHLEISDPTFKKYPLTEYHDLICQDMTDSKSGSKSKFYLRKISRNGNSIGYIQVELDAPEEGQCWLPMLVFLPNMQSSGFGKETVSSLLAQLINAGDFTGIGLNVYAENPNALKFWYKNGFNKIIGIDRETLNDRSYTCITLWRSLHA